MDKHGRRTLLTPGWAFLEQIPGPFTYGYPPERTDTYELLYVSLGGLEGVRWCQRIVAAHGHVLNCGNHASIAPLMTALAHEVQTRRLDRYMISAMLYQLLMTVLSTLDSSRLAMRPLVNAALGLLGEGATTRAFDIQKLASALGVSREHLSREFRAAMGVSPSEYLMQQRMRIAAGHLRSSDEKLERIAALSGFSSANYLVRAFRQYAGVTPAQFRRSPLLTLP